MTIWNKGYFHSLMLVKATNIANISKTNIIPKIKNAP
jgi:hypothetical protein